MYMYMICICMYVHIYTHICMYTPSLRFFNLMRTPVGVRVTQSRMHAYYT